MKQATGLKGPSCLFLCHLCVAAGFRSLPSSNAEGKLRCGVFCACVFRDFFVAEFETDDEPVGGVLLGLFFATTLFVFRNRGRAIEYALFVVLLIMVGLSATRWTAVSPLTQARHDSSRVHGLNGKSLRLLQTLTLADISGIEWICFSFFEKHYDW